MSGTSNDPGFFDKLQQQFSDWTDYVKDTAFARLIGFGIWAFAGLCVFIALVEYVFSGSVAGVVFWLGIPGLILLNSIRRALHHIDYLEAKRVHGLSTSTPPEGTP